MEVFDSGKFHVTVPNGWLAFLGTDSNGNRSPKKVHIYKEIRFETEMCTHAGITVCFFDKEDYYLSPKHFYDNIIDIDPFKLGDFTWNGYTCTSLGYPYIMLDTKNEKGHFQLMILMKNREHEISLDDTDVRCIIESLNITDKE